MKTLREHTNRQLTRVLLERFDAENAMNRIREGEGTELDELFQELDRRFNDGRIWAQSEEGTQPSFPNYMGPVQ